MKNLMKMISLFQNNHIQRSIFLMGIGLLLTFGLEGQTLFFHTATAQNTNGHITTLSNNATDGKPGAILLVTQKNGTINDNEIGVWYNAGKWKIFNQNRQAMPANASFNVLVIDPATVNKAFVHTTSTGNTSGHITTLESRLTNNQANAMVFVTQRYGKYNTVPVGVWYNGGKWKIYNEDRSQMPLGTQFNVLVVNQGKISGLNNMSGESFIHTTTAPKTAVMTRPNIAIRPNTKVIKPTTTSAPPVIIDHNATNNKADAGVFVTQVYLGAYNPNVIAVRYKAPNWTIINQNKKAILPKTAFNVLSLEQAKFLTLNPNLNKAVLQASIKNPSWNKKVTSAIKLDPSKMVLLPYKPKKPSGEESPGVDEDDTEIKGPDLSIGKDLSSLLDDNGYDLFLNKLNIFREVYEDQNPKSGFFYYLPASYNLNWNDKTGEYAFYIYYLSSNGGGRGDVVVTAELTPGIKREDVELAESLLSKEYGKEVKLRPMPLVSTPTVSFGNALNIFDVDPNTVSTNIPTDFLQPIIVSWKMGQRVDDFVGAMLNNTGIIGNVEFTPYSEIEKNITVTSRLKVNDEQTYGVLEFKNAAEILNGFHNPTDYKLVLKNLVVLREDANKTLSIETIPLADYEVEPDKIFASFTDGERNSLLNGGLIKKLWLDYSLVRPCSSCDETVQNKILDGTSSSRVNNIEIEVLTPLEAAAANSMKVLIKSKQGDPKGESEVILPIINISEDNQTISGGELFIGEGESPAFEYQMVLIQPDGTVKSSEWIESKDLFIVIGAATIQQHFPNEE